MLANKVYRLNCKSLGANAEAASKVLSCLYLHQKRNSSSIANDTTYRPKKDLHLLITLQIPNADFVRFHQPWGDPFPPADEYVQCQIFL